MTELERIEQAAEFFRRYNRKEAAITQNRENQEYLKTYIREESYVTDNFHFRDKFMVGLGISGGAGILLFLIFWAITKFIWVALGIGAFVFIGGAIAFLCIFKYALDEEKQLQKDINSGISEQIEILKQREPQIIAEKEKFEKGLEERVPFISVNDMKYLPELKRMIEEHEAETCEDAAALLEQKLLFQQFNSIMENQEIEQSYTAYTYTEAENKQKMSSMVDAITQNTKKSFWEKLFGRRKAKYDSPKRSENQD